MDEYPITDVFGFDVIVDYIKKNGLDSKGKDVYEFGVCTGNSTDCFLHNLKRYEIEYNHYYGFDSLCGLPKEKEGLFCPDIWEEGSFNSQSFLNIQGVENAKKYFVERFKKFPFTIIDGFYNETLTDDIAKDMRPALFISMDVDLYTSCKTAMDFLCRNSLLVPGSIIRYDDWTSAPEDAGESLAHSEIEKEYGIEFDDIDCPGTIIKVVKNV